MKQRLLAARSGTAQPFRQPLPLLSEVMQAFCFPLSLAVLFTAPLFAAAAESAGKTKQLIEVLQSPTADLHAKARACQQAGEFGTAEIIPVLAALLGDEHLSTYARSGLENIPDPAAATALRSALGTLKGDRLMGVVNSLGVLRDEKAVGALQQLASDPASGMVKPALLALGHIANPEAIGAIQKAARSGPAQFRKEAASACLLAAERQVASGHSELAKAIYDDLRAAGLPKPLQAAAVRGAILARGKGGLPLLLEQLRSSDPDVRNVALRTAREMPGSEITAALTAELKWAKADLQELLIGVLVERCEAQVLQPVETLLTSDSAAVRLAAIHALAKIGGPSSLPLLLKQLTSTNEGESSAALASLAEMQAAGINKSIAKELPRMDPKTRALLIGILGDRNATEVAPSLLEWARSPDAEVSTAAFKALATVGQPEVYAKLVPVLLATPEGPVRTQAERTVYLTSLRLPLERRVEPVLSAFRSASHAADKKTLIRTLGLLGTGPACEVVKSALQDPDETVREAAFRALIDWPDAAAMPALLQATGSNSTPTHRALALRGAIRLASREHSSAEAPRWFQQLNQSVSSPAEKRLILPGLAQLADEHVEGLQMLQDYLQDPSVAAEASAAVVQKAGAVVKGRSKVAQPSLLKALLETVAAGNGSKTQRDEASSLAKQLPGPGR